MKPTSKEIWLVQIHLGDDELWLNFPSKDLAYQFVSANDLEDRSVVKSVTLADPLKFEKHLGGDHVEQLQNILKFSKPMNANHMNVWISKILNNGKFINIFFTQNFL